MFDVTCGGVDDEGFLSVPTEEAVADAPACPIWVLSLSLSHGRTCVFEAKVRNNQDDARQVLFLELKPFAAFSCMLTSLAFLEKRMPLYATSFT